MKKYGTVYSSGYTEATSSPHEAANWVNREEEQTWWLAGKQVSVADFFAAARAAVEAAWEKKNQTHKRVSVLHGSSVACYVQKWVRR